jgi:hypothetical protein
MRTAPLVAGWKRRMLNLPGPLMGGSPAGGVPLLPRSPAFTAMYPNARLVVEMAWGADLADPTSWSWVDITQDVLQGDGQTISISPMGRSDNTSKTQPAACGLTVGANDSAIKYMRGPQSPNYPNVHQNIPLRVWVTLTGASNDMEIQFQGEAWSLKPTFNKRGNVAWVTIRAAGKMRQLTQGARPLDSALYRAISRSDNLVGYWPCEDGVNSRQAASAIGAAALLLTGSLVFATSSAPAGGASAVSSSSSATGKLSGSVPATGTSWHIEAWVAVDVSGSNVQPIMSWTTTGSVTYWELRADINGTYIETLSAGTDTTTTMFDFTTNPFRGNTAVHHIRIESHPEGPYVQLYVDDVLNNIPLDMTGLTFGSITSVTVNPPSLATAGTNNNLLSFSHLAIWSATPSLDTTTAASGYTGETATARLIRLCGEQGVPIDITGDTTATMGPQGVATFVDLLRECEAADQGMLGDGLGPGLYYVTRTSRYNQAAALALDATTGADLADSPAPEDDDQKLRNRYVVTRKNGSTAVFEDTNGPLGTATVGTYESTPGGNINVETDDQLPGLAAWLVHLGTVEGYRYPTLPIDLRTVPRVAAAWAGMRPGQRITVANVSSVSPEHPAGTIDLLAEGWSQQLSPMIWSATLNCSPAAPWNVAVVSDSRYRVGSNQSTLTNTVQPGGTTMIVDGHTWTSTGPFPFDVNVGGWQVTVTFTAGDAFLIDPAPGLLLAGSRVTMWTPATVALA